MLEYFSMKIKEENLIMFELDTLRQDQLGKAGLISVMLSYDVLWGIAGLGLVRLVKAGLV